MVNKCVVFGCNSGYSTCKENVSSFRFPAANPELLQKWIKFVNRADWIPTKNSVICCKHFESKFLNEGKRTKLHWKLNPIPTVHAAKGLQQESSKHRLLLESPLLQEYINQMSCCILTKKIRLEV